MKCSLPQDDDDGAIRSLRTMDLATPAWVAGVGFFVLGMLFSFGGLHGAGWVTAPGCLICGIVLLARGAPGRGVCCLTFGLATLPALAGAVMP
ncbi:MAG TPA: hypothetical protein VG796_21185 [Verrucomicrobiales bacterium]|jgi:hypothetical protein|nr:hypothetical protein [Verrucomicrobiales bacterium]